MLPMPCDSNRHPTVILNKAVYFSVYQRVPHSLVLTVPAYDLTNSTSRQKKTEVGPLFLHSGWLTHDHHGASPGGKEREGR